MQCDLCKKFFPPGFVHTENPKTGEPNRNNGNLCIWCIEGKNTIEFDKGKSVSRNEIEKEYQIFLRRVKDDNQILKDVAKGKTKEASKIIL